MMLARGRALLKLFFRGGLLHWHAEERRVVIDPCSLQTPVHNEQNKPTTKTQQTRDLPLSSMSTSLQLGVSLKFSFSAL